MSRDAIKAFVQKRPVSTYFALTVAISWTGALVLLGPGAFPLEWERFEKLGAALYIVILLGPCAAALLLTSLLDGHAGLRALRSRLGRWRVGAGWYAFALVPALLLAASQLILSTFVPSFVPALVRSHEKASAILLSLGVGLTFGAFEEIGWSGFAVPRMRLRHTVLTTGIVVGLVWGAWHFLLFWESDSFSAALPFALLLVRLLSWLPAFRLLMVWVYDRTGSALLPMLMHASLVFAQLMLRPQHLRGPALLGFVLLTPAAMWLLAVVVLAIAGRRPASGAEARRAAAPAPGRGGISDAEAPIHEGGAT